MRGGLSSSFIFIERWEISLSIKEILEFLNESNANKEQWEKPVAPKSKSPRKKGEK